MQVKFVAINNSYGGFPLNGVEREYESVEAFNKVMDELTNLNKEDIKNKFNGFHPLNCSNPVLYKINLADDEYYSIDEYDGMESLHIFKKGSITSTFEKVSDPGSNYADEDDDDYCLEEEWKLEAEEESICDDEQHHLDLLNEERENEEDN